MDEWIMFQVFLSVGLFLLLLLLHSTEKWADSVHETCKNWIEREEKNQPLHAQRGDIIFIVRWKKYQTEEETMINYTSFIYLF